MTGTHSIFSLSGDVGVKSAGNLAADLHEAIGKHSVIGIDTLALSAADITTVQTLLAARRLVQARGGSLVMLAPIGAPLHDLLLQAGLLAPGQEDAEFWSATPDQPAGSDA